MCGIVGVVLDSEQATPVLVDCLTTLQHRGQDAAGIATTEGNHTYVHKVNGQVSDLIESKENMNKLTGKQGIGHVRYPTAGTSAVDEAQPFYTNCPFGLALAHNGNLTNTKELQRYCRKVIKRQVNTGSDSEVILSIFADELHKALKKRALAVGEEKDDDSYLLPSDDEDFEIPHPTMESVFEAVSRSIQRFSGGYAVVLLINGLGLLAFRDPCGIRPLCCARRGSKSGRGEAMVASESVAAEVAGFSLERDLGPGEAVLVDQSGSMHFHQCCAPKCLAPCIFEYVYFARQDSVIDGVSVYAARVNMGELLAKRIQQAHPGAAIDVVVPVPATSRISAIQCALALGVPYEEGLVRNRYSGRTFIMPGQEQRKKSVRLKLNPVSKVIKGRAVLLVDDSIVRGTTSRHIVEMVRNAGATAVYFASAAPPIRFPNVYGIDMPTRTELIAFNRDEAQIAGLIRADWVCYQDLEDLKQSVRRENPRLERFDTSCFDGEYVAEPLSEEYFAQLHRDRNDSAQTSRNAAGGLAAPPPVTRAGSFVVADQQEVTAMQRAMEAAPPRPAGSGRHTLDPAAALAQLQLSPKKKSRKSSADYKMLMEGGFQKQRNLTPSSSSLAEY